MRRREVARLLAVGMKQSDIARQLGVHRSTINNDTEPLEGDGDAPTESGPRTMDSYEL